MQKRWNCFFPVRNSTLRILCLKKMFILILVFVDFRIEPNKQTTKRATSNGHEKKIVKNQFYQLFCLRFVHIFIGIRFVCSYFIYFSFSAFILLCCFTQNHDIVHTGHKTLKKYTKDNSEKKTRIKLIMCI